MALLAPKNCCICLQEYIGEFYELSCCPECEKKATRELRMTEIKKKSLAKVRRKCNCRVV